MLCTCTCLYLFEVRLLIDDASLVIGGHSISFCWLYFLDPIGGQKPSSMHRSFRHRFHSIFLSDSERGDSSLSGGKLASFHFDSLPLRYTCSDNSFDTTAYVVELCPQFHKMASFIAVISSDRLVLTTASLWARCFESSTSARCNVGAAAVL